MSPRPLSNHLRRLASSGRGALSIVALSLILVANLRGQTRGPDDPPAGLIVFTVERLLGEDLDDEAFAAHIPNLRALMADGIRREVVPDADDSTLAPLGLVLEADAFELADLRSLQERDDLPRKFARAGWRTFAAHRRFGVRDPHSSMTGFATAFGSEGPFEWGYSREKIARLIDRGIGKPGGVYGWIHIPWAGDQQINFQGIDSGEVGGRRRAGLALFDALLGDVRQRLLGRPEFTLVIAGVPGHRPGEGADSEVVYPLIIQGPLASDWPADPAFALHDVGTIARGRLGVGEAATETAPPLMWRGARPGRAARRLVAFDGQSLVTIDLLERTTVTSSGTMDEASDLMRRVDQRLGGGQGPAAIIRGRLRRGDTAAAGDLANLIPTIADAADLRRILLEAVRSGVTPAPELIEAIPAGAGLDLITRSLRLRRPDARPLAVLRDPWRVPTSPAPTGEEVAETLRALGEAVRREGAPSEAEGTELLLTRVRQLEAMVPKDRRSTAEASLVRLRLGDAKALVALRRAILDPRVGAGRARFLNAIAERDPEGTRTLLEILLGYVDEPALREAALDLVTARGWRTLDRTLVRLAEKEPLGVGRRAAEILLSDGVKGRRAALLTLAARDDQLGAKAAGLLLADGALVGSPWLPGQRWTGTRTMVFATSARFSFERERTVYLLAESPEPLPLERGELPRIFIEGRTLVPRSATRVGDHTVVRFEAPALGPGLRAAELRANRGWRDAGARWLGIAGLPEGDRIPARFAVLGGDEGANGEFSVHRGTRKFEAEVWWQRRRPDAPSVVLEATMKGARPARLTLVDETGRGRLRLESLGGRSLRLAFPALEARAWRVVVTLP